MHVSPDEPKTSAHVTSGAGMSTESSRVRKIARRLKEAVEMGSQLVGRREVLRTAGGVGAAGLLAVVTGPQVAAADEREDDRDSRSPAGTWFETDESATFKFGVLLTFDVGGGLVGTADIDSIKNSNLLGSPTHGAWVKTGGRSYRWFGKAFSFNDTTGALDGTYEIKETLTLNERGDRFEGQGAFRIVGGTHPIPNFIPYKTKGERIKA
jgi:hypothetical protein